MEENEEGLKRYLYVAEIDGEKRDFLIDVGIGMIPPQTLTVTHGGKPYTYKMSGRIKTDA